jgi:hypothetical protein
MLSRRSQCCKLRIGKGFSLLTLAEYCRRLRPRLCQSGVKWCRGNQERSDKSLTVRLDKSAPDAPLISSPAQSSRDNDGSFSVSGSAEVGAKVELFEGEVSKGEHSVW